jgi:protein-S-isoprenylcysteine O-methyltransferase Ste14
MKEIAFFDLLLLIMFVLAASVFIALFFVAAPYGRHSRRGWGPALSPRFGWIIMEAAAPLVFLACYAAGPSVNSMAALVFLSMWELHYLHRAFIFPFSMRNQAGRMTLVVIGLGFLFNTANAYLNGRYVFHFSGGYPADWLTRPTFIIGATIFAGGFIINRHADWTLRGLRRPGESGYKIPYGGLYRWISCPNYSGEILVWLGWAVATWSLPGLAFAVWTAANLVPRARSHQRWYRERFPDYPARRKALVPLVW